MQPQRMALLLLVALTTASSPAAQVRATTNTSAAAGKSDVYCGSGNTSNSSTSDGLTWLQPRANALSSHCNGVCGSDEAGFVCVFRSQPLVGCDGDGNGDGDSKKQAASGARCVNGATCGYECIAVAPKASSWSIDWSDTTGDVASGLVTITTALSTGEPPVATYVSGPIESLDELALPATVTDLSLIGSRSTREPVEIGSGSKLLPGLAQLATLELKNVQIEDWDELPSMPELTTLTLINASVPKWPVVGVPDTLQYLEISDNVQLAEALAAATLPSGLQSLSLKNCGLTQFPLSGVQALKTLYYLSLDGNALSSIEADSLPTTLTYLSLRNCGLKDVPSDIVNISELGTLDLSTNPLGAIEPSTLPFSSLSVLTLSNCSLQSFPFAVTKDNVLDTLDLSWNPLFPQNEQELASIESLHMLDLSYTNLTKISQAVLDFVTKKISLSGNPLQEFTWPSSANVLFMNVSNCQLSDVPTEVTKLRFLDISKNQFTTVPESITLSETLLTLVIDENPIASIKTLPRNLSSFSAVNCSLESLPSLGMENLQELNLRSNKLNSINGLMASPSKTKKALSTLDLRGNQFTSIPALVWELPSISDFEFQENPVSPLLRLQQSEVDWINQRKKVGLDAESLDSTSCTTPTRLSYSYSVCTAMTESGFLVSNGEARSIEGSASSDAQFQGISAEQDAENRQAMLITGIVLLVVLVVYAIGFVFLYRAGDNKKDAPPPAAERAKPKPNSGGANNETQPQRTAAGSSSAETKAPLLSKTAQNVLPPAAAPAAVKQDPNADLIKWKIEGHELAMEDEIAWGRTCAVFTAMYRGRRVVVKKLLRQVNKESEAMFLQELKVLSQLQHEKIVQLVGVSWVKQYQKLQLVLEYMPYGDLQTYLSSLFIDKKTLQQYYLERWSTYGSAMKIALDVAEAMEYVHAVNLVEFAQRRILTSRQILLDDELHAKMSDFGGRQQIDNTTARWLAPEVLDGESNYNEAADVYALGVVLWELDTCDLPFAQYLPERDFGLSRIEFNDEVEVLWQRIAKGELRLTPRDDCPPTMRRLILKCLSPEPFARPSALSVLQTLREVAAPSNNSFSGQSSRNSSGEAFTSVRAAKVIDLDSPGSTSVLTNTNTKPFRLAPAPREEWL